MTLPFILLLCDASPLNRYRTRQGMGVAQRHLLWEKAPFLAISLAQALLTVAAQRSVLASLDTLPLVSRLTNATVFLGWHVWASLYPVGLAASYPFPRQGYPAYLVELSVIGLADCAAHWRDAETLWRRTAAVCPMSDKALTNLGWALHARGADDEAMGWFAAGLTVNPRHSDCANTLGLLLLERGRIDDAERCFRLAIDVSPELVAPRSNLGATLARRGYYREAKKVFDAALRLDPDDIGALYNYGVMLEAAGDTEAARESLRAVLRVDPSHPQAGRKLHDLETAAP